MKNESSRVIYESIIAQLEKKLPGKVKHGFFGEEMLVSIQNHGPCTLTIESREEHRPEDLVQ